MIGAAGATPSSASVGRVARGFDLLSPVYDLLAWSWLGGRIPQSQIVWLPEALARAPTGPALIVGGGSGRFVGQLIDAGFQGRIVCLDVSRGMLERTRRLLSRRFPGRAGQVELRHGGVERLAGGERFALIATHYFLDLFDEPALREVMRKLDGALAPSGVWLYSDFAPPSGGPVRRRVQRWHLRALYTFFGAVCSIGPRRLPPISEGFRELRYDLLREARPARGWLESRLLRRSTTGER